MTHSPRWSGRTKGVLLAINIALLFGLRFFWATPKGAAWFQANLGYYVVLGLVIATLVFFGQAARAGGWFAWSRWREHRNALLLIIGGTVFLHLHEPHVMRVLYDEPTHALAALNMHLDKSAMAATVSNYVGETFTLSDPYPIARAYLFPVLVSVLHDLTGYRVANVFVLNVLLTPLVLLSGYLVAYRLGGRLAGYVAVGLLITLPLLAQNVTSGGYDVLNMALVGALVFCTVTWFQAPEGQRGPLLNLSLAIALLLAVARAESMLYLVPWGVVVLALWRRERRMELTGFAVVSPLLLVPGFMSNLLMMRNDVAMGADLRAKGEGFLDIGHLPGHLSEAVYYLFHFDLESTNSALLAALGFTGFVMLLVQVGGAARARRLKSAEVIVALFAVWVIAVYGFVLTQFWSSPIDPLAARFCLPMLLVWSVLAGWLVAQVPWARARPVMVYGVLGLWAIVAAAPMMSGALATYALTPAWADAYFLDYAKTRDRKTTLYAAQGNAAFVIHRYASCPLQRVRVLPAAYVRAIKAGLYRDVLVLQILEGSSNGSWRPRVGQEMPEHVVLETVSERMVNAFALARVSRLVGYRKKDGTMVTPASDDPDVKLRDDFPDPVSWKKYRLSLYP